MSIPERIIRNPEAQGGIYVVKTLGLDTADGQNLVRTQHTGTRLELQSVDPNVTDAVLAASPLAVHPTPRLALDANVTTRAGLLTLQGVLLAAGDLVLLTAQTTKSQNGLYQVQANDATGAATAWTRVPHGLYSGQLFTAQAGTNAGKTYRLKTVGTIVIDTTALEFDQVATSTSGGGSAGFYGDGSDGDVTIAADTGLTRDMYYRNLVISGTAKLSASGYRIFASQSITVASGAAIRNNGNAASGATAGAARSAASIGGGTAGGNGSANAGSNGTGTTSSLGGAGGAGGGSGAQAGGTAGAAAAPAASLGSIRQLPAAILGLLQGGGSSALLTGGGGGGGGGGDTTNSGGGGGGGAGVLIVAAPQVTLNGADGLQAMGGAGAAGVAANGAGGGGGGGGVIILVRTQRSGAGTMNVDGGAAGAGAGTGAAGTAGAAGTIIEVQN